MVEAAYRAAGSGPRPLPRRSPGSAGSALWLAGLCAAALALTWVLAELVPAFQARDAATLYHFTILGGSGMHEAARLVIHLLDPLLFTIWALALVLIAIARERLRVALAAATLLALAPISADRLKPLLAYHHAHVGRVFHGYASWPSGHATAAATLALCAVLVAPARMRRAVAFAGVAFALIQGAALLIDAWHMPSDVLGGYLMAALWTALAVAALRAAERRWPSRPRPQPRAA
jgi:membrane-associated phospholipid phosphatase